MNHKNHKNHKNHVIYDIEVYKNVFTCVTYAPEYDEYLVHEVSERCNDFEDFLQMLEVLADDDTRMVGFNNFGYDYPVIHHLLKWGRRNHDASWEDVTKEARAKSDQIINSGFNDRFKNTIWDRDQIVKQIDLMKIHHFDNAARATSLKKLEFNMESSDVGDLPFDVNHLLSGEEIDELLKYNKHDVEETYKFYLKTLDKIEFREEMSPMVGKDLTNHNDTKIGKDLFIKELERQIDRNVCFRWEDGQRHINQTKRSEIRLNECIFDYIEFEQPCFQKIKEWISQQTITETKGVFTELEPDNVKSLLFYSNLETEKKKIKNLNCVYKGIQFDFGTGGLHACIKSGTYVSDDEYTIIDLDVTSYYPSLAIENNVYPAHLGIEFCKIYDQLKTKRMSYDKGTAENLALKLALNGVYGDSNNKYSPFFDPKYTMTITINGQLLLCMLSEQCMDKIEGLQLLQVNTDGITVRIPRDKVSELDVICEDWEKLTSLELERATYSRMFIRDCNNYVAEYEGGGVKRKGAYEYDLAKNGDWHKNFSQLVVPKAAEAYLLHGQDITEFIENHDHPFDFYLLAKCDRNSRMVYRVEGEEDEVLQRNNRFYASNTGGEIIKISPPLVRKLVQEDFDELRRLGVELTDEGVEVVNSNLKNKEPLEDWQLEGLYHVKPSEEMGRLKKYIDLEEEERFQLALELFQPKEREFTMCSESLTTVHNKADRLVDVNIEYYVEQVERLVEPIERNL